MSLLTACLCSVELGNYRKCDARDSYGNPNYQFLKNASFLIQKHSKLSYAKDDEILSYNIFYTVYMLSGSKLNFDHSYLLQASSKIITSNTACIYNLYFQFLCSLHCRWVNKGNIHFITPSKTVVL